jgi:hypothetical protein
MILVPLLNPKFAIVFAATVCANFGFGALVLSSRRGDRLEAELESLWRLPGDSLQAGIGLPLR